jgi:hypothetical protein
VPAKPCWSSIAATNACTNGDDHKAREFPAPAEAKLSEYGGVGIVGHVGWYPKAIFGEGAKIYDLITSGRIGRE